MPGTFIAARVALIKTQKSPNILASVAYRRYHGMTGVHVSNVTIKETPSGARLSARLQGGPGLPPTLWFEVPAAFADGLSARGDPFLPILVLRAMQRPGPIVIEAEGPADLLARARRAAALLDSWGLP